MHFLGSMTTEDPDREGIEANLVYLDNPLQFVIDSVIQVLVIYTCGYVQVPTTCTAVAIA